MTRHESTFKGGDQTPEVSPEKIGGLLARSSDIVIIMDRDGRVRRVTVNPNNPQLGCLDHWEGRTVYDFLTSESKVKLEARIAEFDPLQEESHRPIELNHVDNANWEFPIRYAMDETGVEDTLILLGRDMRPIAEAQQQLVKAQLALERDYEKARDFETRFQVLLHSTREPIVFVDAKTGRVVNGNAPAARLLGPDPEALTGASFPQMFEGVERKSFVAALREAAASPSPEAEAVKGLARGSRQELSIRPTLFRSAVETLLLCRLEAAREEEPAKEELRDALAGLYDTGPDAVVFTNRQGDVRYANEGFLVQVDAPELSAIQGDSLARFLARGAVDLKVLIENAGRTGRLRAYSATLNSLFGTQAPVLISAVALKGRPEQLFAFVIRDASRVESSRAPNEQGVNDVVELVGSTPLKELVSATSDVVEKLCIETALELTRNNRVAAAEMLGLSRQSLYVKLRKYGLVERDGDDAS